MNSQVFTADIFKAIEKWAPKDFAYDWDPIGLQIGSFHKPVKRVMITLDVLEPVVDEAIKKKIDLIIAHHPLLFRPLKQINFETPIGRVVQKLIQNDITVYAAHTNLDIAPGGVNDMLCRHLNLQGEHYVIKKKRESLFKIAVFVPNTHVEQVRDAMAHAGAGFIGGYSHCTFQTKGQGTFKPHEGTDPYIGEVDKLTFVDEYKIETIVEERIMDPVIQAMIEAHPYEEVAYDVYPLANKGKTYGLGRIARLDQKITLEEFAKQVKKAFDDNPVRVIGSLDQQVQKVAVIGGSGEKYIHQAKQRGADVLITGDLTFHTAQEAEAIGVAVIDAGHYIEVVMKEAMKKKLQEHFAKKEIEWFISDVNTNPFQLV